MFEPLVCEKCGAEVAYAVGLDCWVHVELPPKGTPDHQVVGVPLEQRQAQMSLGL
jgi:hypothetical protein